MVKTYQELVSDLKRAEDALRELAAENAVEFNRVVQERDKAVNALQTMLKQHEKDRELAAENDAEIEGLRHTFKLWQEDSDTLAAEFPGVDWTHCADFVPHVRELREDNAKKDAEIAELKEKLIQVDVACLALQQVCEKQREALRPLDAIAHRFSDSDLDEARPAWGDSEESAKHVELVASRGGKGLLTLGDCFAGRDASRTKPDLSLLDEVRKVLGDCATFMPDPEVLAGINQLLTKLGS